MLINLYGTHQRVAWALGVDDIEEITERVRKLLGLTQGPPAGIVNKLKTVGELAGLARSRPKTVKSAPCQEVVLTGDDADVNAFPILKCWPLDGGRYITLPLVISRDPTSGRRNVGTYRMQVFDGKTMGMHWQSHKVGARHYRDGEERRLERLDVAVALGGDPTTIWTGSMPLPPDMDEIAASGVIRGKPVEMVKCKTIDLEVPAHAEIVLEGYVVPGELRPEGPFGDHTGYYSLAEDYPVFHLTAITHRRNPIYPTTFVGVPPKEDFFMGKATERIMLPALQAAVPEVIDINMPAEGIFHNLVIVSIRKEYPGHARKVMNALWGLGLMMLTKVIVIVDHYVDVQDLSEVAWRVTANLDPGSDIVFSEGPLDDLEHASATPRYGTKMGIDATAKGRLDGRTREWPPDIVMSDEIKALVDSKWREYRDMNAAAIPASAWRKTALFLDAIKFHESIFALPFAYTGMILAVWFESEGARWYPTLHQFLWITVAMVGARTVGMAANRIIDRYIDAQNPRNASRHLPSGKLSVRDMTLLTLAALAIFIFAAYQLNTLALILAPVAVAYLVFYPYTKRFTWASNLLLGWALAIAPSAAWIGVTGSLTWQPVLLSLAVALWAGSFDILYHTQDYDFQKQAGLRSVATKFGVVGAFWWARVLDPLALVALIVLGIWLGLAWPYYIGIALAAAFLVYKHRLVSPDDLSSLGMAFFRINAYVSTTMFAATLIAVLL